MKFIKFGLIAACMTSFMSSHASTSLSVSGHAGAIGQYLHGMPPLSLTYTAFQVPVGLILQANPSDAFSLFLELDYAYVNYPVPPILLGQTESTTQFNANGNSIPLPFANSINRGGPELPFGQKIDTVQLIQAYFSYQTPIGLFRAGRMPRNWGLGIWYDANWTAQGSGISTTDALAFTTDFGMYDVTLYYEKYGQSIGGIFNNGTATGYTVEGRLKTSPIDPPSSGVSRNIGIIYSKFIHQQSGTDLNILDLYGKFYFSRFFLGGEVLFPSGKTQNPNYQTVGGAPQCTFNGAGDYKTCSSQNMAALGALLKLKVRLDSPTHNSTYYALEKSLKLVGTRERQNSHTGEFWAGYASGGSNQFDSPDQININSNKITALRFNPNVLPSLMMFTNTFPMANGMPTASITNSTFVRLGYSYQSNQFGSITPTVVWGMINFLNKNFNSTNPICAATPTVNYSNPINNFCVGNAHNLGTEFDLSYAYTTEHLVTGQIDAGYWLIGNAWKTLNQKIPYSTFGIRMIVSTEF